MQCQFDEDAVGATMSGMVVIKPGSESELQAAVAYVGPVSVAVDASSNGFRVCVHTQPCSWMCIIAKMKCWQLL